MRSMGLMVWLMLSLSLAGCLEGPTVSSDNRGDTTEDELRLPSWSVGDQWLYTFVTPQFGEDSARLVVAEVNNESGLYRLGISSEREAQRHAVINHNPFLGRVTMDGLSVYEQGEPQPVFNFPWNEGTAGVSRCSGSSGRPRRRPSTTAWWTWWPTHPTDIT